MTLPWTPEDRDWDLEILRRFQRAGFTFVSLTLTDWPPTFEGTLGSIQRFKDMVSIEASDWLSFATSLANIERARSEGKLVVGFNSQETLPIGTDLARIETLHAAGIRHMLLAYNVRNFVADGCAESADAGLSNFGRKVVQEMNRIGVVVDCSHTARRSTLEAIELSGRPTIFSHSGAYEVEPHIRNIRDDQIRACAAKGGVIGIVGIGSFLGDWQAQSESLFRHIDYVAELVGPEHVGLGTDHVPPATFRKELARAAYQKYGVKPWPDAEVGWTNPTGTQLPRGSPCFQPEQLTELVGIMLAHGYPEGAVKKILGGNFRRVYATVL